MGKDMSWKEAKKMFIRKVISVAKLCYYWKCGDKGGSYNTTMLGTLIFEVGGDKEMRYQEVVDDEKAE